MRIAPFLFAACLATALPALAEDSVSYHDLPAPAGLGRLVLPMPQTRPVPLVVLVPDVLGEDGRAEPYVDALAARGIATLVLGLEADPDRINAPRDPASSPEAARLGRDWAATRRDLAPAVGLLGFGAGARAVLAAAADSPVVALYPLCTGLVLPEWSPTVVVHGTGGPDSGLCDSRFEGPSQVIVSVPGIGHAWDMPPHGSEAPSLVPNPAGPGRLHARYNARVTLQIADAVAGWLAIQLSDRMEAAATASPR